MDPRVFFIIILMMSVSVITLADTPQVLVVYPADNSLEVVYHALEYGDGTRLVTK